VKVHNTFIIVWQRTESHTTVCTVHSCKTSVAILCLNCFSFSCVFGAYKVVLEEINCSICPPHSERFTLTIYIM